MRKQSVRPARFCSEREDEWDAMDGINQGTPKHGDANMNISHGQEKGFYSRTDRLQHDQSWGLRSHKTKLITTSG